MDGLSIQFEAADLAGWLWVVVALLAAAEGLRYALAGRRPASRAARGGLVLAAAGVLAAMRAAGWLRLDASSHGWACAWLAVLATVWLARSYRQTTQGLRQRARLVLLGLRVTAGLMIVLLLAGPVLEQKRVRTERAVLGILLDDSRSMTVRDVVREGSPPISRVEAVKLALEQNRDALNRLGNELELHWFAFDAEAREQRRPRVSGEGAYTALGDALGRVHELLGQGERRLAGMVVVSDGRDNFSAGAGVPAAADALAAAGVPVYAVGVGSAEPVGQTRGLTARRLDCPEQVSRLNRLGVRAEFLAAGLAGEAIEAELVVDDEVVDRQEARPGAGRELVSVALSHVPAEGGLHRVTVRARAASVEGERGEASLSQFVRVVDDKVRVLYVDRARYERAAIARALQAAKEFEVRTVDANQPVRAEGDSRRDDADLRSYHVVLIGDVDPTVFTDGSLKALAERVREGECGLAMLGGVRSLGSGGYAGTALAGLLPVDLKAVGQLPGPVMMTLTAAGRVHPVCQLAEDPTASEATWRRLPAMTGASALGVVGAAAEVLIASPEGKPLLVVQEVGKGRVAVVAFDSTWQWSFAEQQGGEAIKRFWRQLVLWLANRPADVWVTTDRPRYELALLRSGKQQVTARAGASNARTGQAMEGVTLSGTMTGPGGKAEALTWVRKEGVQEAALSVEQAGEYRVEVVAKSGEQEVGRSASAFVVTATDIELMDAIADLGTLRELGARTQAFGGRFVPVESFGELIEAIGAAGCVAEVVEVHRRHVVETWPWAWLGVFVGVLAVEWIVRRRAGLV